MGLGWAIGMGVFRWGMQRQHSQHFGCLKQSCQPWGFRYPLPYLRTANAAELIHSGWLCFSLINRWISIMRDLIVIQPYAVLLCNLLKNGVHRAFDQHFSAVKNRDQWFVGQSKESSGHHVGANDTVLTQTSCASCAAIINHERYCSPADPASTLWKIHLISYHWNCVIQSRRKNEMHRMTM